MAEHVQDGATLNADEFAPRIGVHPDALEDLWGEWAVVRFEENGANRYPVWQLGDRTINPKVHQLLAHASQAEITPRQLHEWMLATGAAGEFAGDPDVVIARFDAEHGV